MPAAYSRATATLAWRQGRRSQSSCRCSGRSVHRRTATRSPGSARLRRRSRMGCTVPRTSSEVVRTVTLFALVAAVTALATPAAGARPRPGTLPTRLPGTLTVALDVGTTGLAEGSVENGALVDPRGFEVD